LAAFAADTVLIVSSEGTYDSLAVLPLDPTTGALGLAPGSPADVGIRIGDAETLAADPLTRRVFFGSNLSGLIAVADLDATGAPVPVAGSPFAAERNGVSVIKVAPAGDSIYVGYHGASILSRYTVDGAGALTLAQTIATDPHGHVETMLLVDDVLYVGFMDTSSIVGYRLDGAGAFLAGPTVAAEIATNVRPDYLQAIETRLYCSLAADGSVDAFDIEEDGSLTRLAGAPYVFPGIGGFELIAVQPGGEFIAVGAETPTAAVGLYAVNEDGSLTPTGTPLALHDRRGGPERLNFSPDGRFLYVCDHVGQGLYVLDTTGGALAFAATPRYQLPGRQIDVLVLELSVVP
jgi:6-phosphogluconolactonase (cycloisomerase 2 family)